MCNLKFAPEVKIMTKIVRKEYSMPNKYLTLNVVISISTFLFYAIKSNSFGNVSNIVSMVIVFCSVVAFPAQKNSYGHVQLVS